MSGAAAAARRLLLEAITARLPELRAEAALLDDKAGFPKAAFEGLIADGLLVSTLPSELGGLAFGDGVAGAEDLFRLLYLLGAASLPMARIFEAHVNALQLILCYGTPAQGEAAAADAQAGRLFALWVTDPPQHGARLDRDGFLHGGKAFCSGAGVVTRAVITAGTDDGAQLLVAGLAPGERVAPSGIRLAGMRAAITGSVDFDGVQIGSEAVLGVPGDYLREPVFSAGAWRGSAAAAGGLGALLEVHREEIRRRQRDIDPHQRARFGQLLIAHETACLWAMQAARRGCLLDGPDAEIIAYINLARIAVEAACLDGIREVQRGLGLAAFMAGHTAERLARDLATYLRQPAPDEVLDIAAAYYFDATPPDLR